MLNVCSTIIVHLLNFPFDYRLYYTMFRTYYFLNLAQNQKSVPVDSLTLCKGIGISSNLNLSKMIQLSPKEIANKHCCYHSCDIGYESTGNGIPIFLDSHTAKIDGKNIECGIGTTL